MTEAVQWPPARTKKVLLAVWLSLAICTTLGALMVVVIALSIRSDDISTGETRESPDGRFEASAMNVSRGTVQGTRDEWVKLRVTERGTGREVWRVKRQPPPGTAPDYGMRGIKFVEWAADSSAVTVDIDGGRKLTFPVP
jgi:hypothetical protein